MTKILEETLLTNEFTFGFELEAIVHEDNNIVFNSIKLEPTINYFNKDKKDFKQDNRNKDNRDNRQDNRNQPKKQENKPAAQKPAQPKAPYNPNEPLKRADGTM